MKITKRVLAALLALTMCAGISACGSDADKDGDNSAKTLDMKEEDKGALNDIANEKLGDGDLANTNLKFLSHWDINPGAGQIVPPDIQMFRDKYNGTFEYIPTKWEDRYIDLQKLVLGGNSPDFFSAMDMDAFPKGAIKGLFQPIDPYIDLDSDLWAPAKSTVDSFVFNGEHYVAGVQSYPQYVCVYNKKTIEENGFEDPAELYWKDQWTWSKFTEMCVAFSDRASGKAGIDGDWYTQALNDSCGTPLISLENGKIVNNMDNARVKQVQKLMYELEENEVCYDKYNNDSHRRGTESDPRGYGMATHETLFYPIGLWGIEDSPENVAGFGDVEAGDIMFVPMPRLDDAGTYYVTARVDGYLLCKDAPNPEGFAAYMNCRMASLTDAQAISENQMREQYKWNDDMIKMRSEVIRLVNEHPLYDFQDAVNEQLSNTMKDSVRDVTLSTNKAMYADWDTVIADQKATVDAIVEDANNNIDTDAK